jgi:hypothetical protein
VTTTAWTLTMTCPLDGHPLGLVNQLCHTEPRTGICRTLITIVACPDGHEWETEINLIRHATTQRRKL